VLARLLFLFVALPLLDLVFLLVLTEATSWKFTVLMVLSTGCLGAYLAKQQGFAAWRRIRQDLSQGRMPAAAALDGVLVLAASLLLLTPGVLSDLAGLSLLVPPIRRRYQEWLLHWFKSRFRVTAFFPRGDAAPRSDVIDSYVVKGSSRDVSDDAGDERPAP
jgi:UPF0716 protein FxsA